MVRDVIPGPKRFLVCFFELPHFVYFLKQQVLHSHTHTQRQIRVSSLCDKPGERADSIGKDWPGFEPETFSKQLVWWESVAEIMCVSSSAAISSDTRTQSPAGPGPGPGRSLVLSACPALV